MSQLKDIINDLEPKPASYMAAARTIENNDFKELKQLNISILSTFTFEVIRPYIITEGARHGLILKPHFCPFNQIEIQAFNKKSELYETNPEIIVLALRLEDIDQYLFDQYCKLSSEKIEDIINKLIDRLNVLIKEIRKNSSANVLVFNFAQPSKLIAGIADFSLPIAQSLMISKLNENLADLCRHYTSTYIYDYSRIVSETGINKWYDNKLWYTARIPFSINAQMSIASNLGRYIRAMFKPSCKCLVLDLDNTLWGGILGEEGVGGIALSESYPGNVFKDFQRYVSSLRDQGVLLAIASKNNEDDVNEVFKKHDDMILKLEDFSALQINWNEKAGNLKAIANELNIGIDSIAFFDDNPVERAWIRKELPMVNVIEAPNNPLSYIEAIKQSLAFDQMKLSTEDTKRAKMMSESNQREKYRLQVNSVEEFLRGLEMKAIIGKYGPETSKRIVQLIERTNQFNLTTRRHSEADVNRIIETGGIVLWMRLEDRFGDNGLIGVAIALPQEKQTWIIDSFLLSCRVIGRQAETLLLSKLIQIIKQKGCHYLIGEYIPTKKNKLVEDFYRSHNFQPTDNKGRYWLLDLISGPEISDINFIDLEYSK